jgi:hypothetical protein
MSINFYTSSSDNLACSVGWFYACDYEKVEFLSSHKLREPHLGDLYRTERLLFLNDNNNPHLWVMMEIPCN